MVEEEIGQKRLMAEVAAERRARRAALLARVRLLHEQGISGRAIGARLGLNRGGVQYWLKLCGLKPHPEEP